LGDFIAENNPASPSPIRWIRLYYADSHVKEKNMDAMKIIKRAWYILWNYRTLWIFGFVLALTVGGTTYNRLGSNSSYQYNNNKPNIQNTLPGPWGDSQTFQDPQKFLDALKSVGSSLTEAIGSQKIVGTLIVFLVAFFLLSLLVSIGMTIMRYVSETAVIRMVDEFETSSKKVSFKQGFRYGWSRTAWKLFLIDLVIGFLPGMALLIVLGLLAWGLVSMAIQIGSNGTGMIAVMAILAGLAFLIILLFSLYFVVVGLLRNFFVRAGVLEQMSVRESLQRGYTLVQRNWRKVGLFWLVMIGLGIAWWVVSIVLVVMLIPFFLVSAVLAVLVAGIPGLLVGFFSSLFVTGYWPIVIGALFGLPLFIPLLASPMLFIEGLAQVFRSTIWTLVFRELKVMETSPVIVQVPSPN
jgi:hypothetical protein